MSNTLGRVCSSGSPQLLFGSHSQWLAEVSESARLSYCGVWLHNVHWELRRHS